MIIDLTAAEKKERQEIIDSFQPEMERIADAIKAARTAGDQEEVAQLLRQRQAIIESIEAALIANFDKMQRKRFKPIKEAGTAAIIAHAKEQAPALLEYIHTTTKNQYAGITAETLKSMGIGTIKDGLLYLNANYALQALRDELKPHVDALMDNKQALQKLIAVLIEAIENSDYTDNTEITDVKIETITADKAIYKANMPIYNGKAAGALAFLDSKNITVNPIADKAILQTKEGDYKIVMQGFSKIKGKLSINTHKLFITGIAEFTHINDPKSNIINPTVRIPLEEYARRLGYKIDERETDSPEAAAKEKKRAQEAVKTARKRILQDLNLLQAMRCTWQEKVNGNIADFDSILLIERVAIIKGYIIMEFGRNFTNYLIQLPINQYPQGLLAIDARSENAYWLGVKMAEHFNMDNNQIRGTANRLKVSNLLAVTKLPTMDTLQHEAADNSRQWGTRIKEPFEAALDVLTGKVISDWEYVKAKGEPLTDAEAYNIADYETFTGLYVQFKLLNAPDHKDRLARRAEEKKAAAARKAAKEKRGSRKKKQ